MKKKKNRELSCLSFFFFSFVFNSSVVSALGADARVEKEPLTRFFVYVAKASPPPLPDTSREDSPRARLDRHHHNHHRYLIRSSMSLLTSIDAKMWQ